MIISTNKEPTLEEFEQLCQKMCQYMNDKAKVEPEYYLSKGAQKLEPEVKTALDIAAKGQNLKIRFKLLVDKDFQI